MKYLIIILFFISCSNQDHAIISPVRICYQVDSLTSLNGKSALKGSCYYQHVFYLTDVTFSLDSLQDGTYSIRFIDKDETYLITRQQYYACLRYSIDVFNSIQSYNKRCRQNLRNDAESDSALNRQKFYAPIDTIKLYWGNKNNQKI